MHICAHKECGAGSIWLASLDQRVLVFGTTATTHMSCFRGLYALIDISQGTVRLQFVFLFSSFATNYGVPTYRSFAKNNVNYIIHLCLSRSRLVVFLIQLLANGARARVRSPTHNIRKVNDARRRFMRSPPPPPLASTPVSPVALIPTSSL